MTVSLVGSAACGSHPFDPGTPARPPRPARAARPDDAVRRARFAALICVHTPALQAIARRLCSEPAAAADLIQDALERAWRRFDSLQGDDRARGWLMQILRNARIDQLRRRRAEVPMEAIPEPPAPASDEPRWWEWVTREDLRWAIAQLDEPFRSVAALHDLEGRSCGDIARRFRIPRVTAATRLHRAHGRVRALLWDKLGARRGAPGGD